MAGIAPLGKMAEDHAREMEEWLERTAKAKAELKYAYIKISVRKYRLIKLSGFGYYGTEQTPAASFRFITDPLPYSQAIGMLAGLVRGEVSEPEYDAGF